MSELIKTASVKELLNLMNSKIPAGYVEVSADKLNNIEGLSDPRIDYKAYYNAQSHDVILTGTNKPQPLGDKADAGIFYTDARNTADGSFVDKTPVAAAQTELVAKYLITREYPDATITLFGQGQVGLAVSIASYDLRNDEKISSRVAATLTYDSWKGQWTANGQPDAGVLDMRSGGLLGDDPSSFYKSWRAGGTVANLDTGNWTDASKIVIKPVVGKVYDGVTEAVSWLADKVPVPGWMPDLGWMADKMMGAAKENVVDAITGAATAWVDSRSSTNSLAWLPENMPVTVASDVLSGKISIGQWNVQQGRSASGYGLNTTNYAATGAKFTSPDGSSQQAFTQITTFKDPATGAVLEARVQGTMVNGQFQATPGSAYVQGLTADGKVVIPGVTDNRTEYAEAIGAGRGVVNPPSAISTEPRSNSQFFITGATAHSVTIGKGGTLSDAWVVQKDQPGGFKDEQEFYLAVMQANPEIRNQNLVKAGQIIYLPQKNADSSITYNYANGVSVNSNAVNGEYHMVVPDGSGGNIVYSRTADEFGYTVREVHTDKVGAVTLDYTGTQATLDAEIKPVGFEWNTSQESGKVQVFDNSSSITSVENKLTGDITETVKDSQQNVVESKTYEDHAARVEAAQQNALLAGVELFDAIRHKNNLGAISAITRLVNESRIAADQPIVFSPQVGAVLGLIGALDSFGDAKTDAQKFVATTRLVLSANTTYAAFNDGKGFLDAGTGFTALNVAGGVLALASLDSTLESGNPFAIASSAMAITNSAAALGLIEASAAFGPQAMIAVAICSIVFGSLFGGDVEYPEPPPAGSVEIGRLADGSLGMLLKDADGKLYQTRNLSGAVLSGGFDSQTGLFGLLSSNSGVWNNQNWALGADVLSQRVASLLGELQTQANKDGTHLVLDRLPTLSVHGYPSFDRNGVDNFFFALRFNDPGTGAQQLMAAANQDMAKQFKEIASYAGAVVDNTEWAQIQAKQAAGDNYATETEGQYVDRQSGTKEGDSLLTKAQADAQEASNTQSYSLLTLDLEGNGIAKRLKPTAGMSLESVKADTTNGVTRFDVDNDGYMELTEWVGSKEAILGLDRNGDGDLSAATELLTGGELSDAAEGLGVKRLAFFDANKDGKLDKLDAYFNSFKLWLDINGDARTGVGEVYGLADAGVQSIDVNTGAVTFADGQKLTLQRTQLSADVRGVSVSAVSDGKGGVLAGQYKVQQEGKDAELNLTADAATDLSDILKLVHPGANATDAEKTQLKTLAAKYGVDLSNPAALLGLGGGGNVAGSATSTTATAADVFTISQAPNADEIKNALKAFFNDINHDPDAGPNLANHVFEAQEDTQLKIKTTDLLAGLSGVKLLSVQEARRGAVKLDANGDVVFDPLANQSGTGYFSYTAKDSQGRVSTAAANDLFYQSAANLS